jgi:hypothetical protein
VYLFNWYIKGGFIFGDVCVKACRLEEYVRDKTKNIDSTSIDKVNVRRKLHVQRINQIHALTFGKSLVGDSLESSEVNVPQGARSGMSKQEVLKVLENDKDVKQYIKDKSLDAVYHYVTIKITQRNEHGLIVGTPDLKTKNSKGEFVYQALSFKLVNMDSFWFKHKDRKQLMLTRLAHKQTPSYTHDVLLSTVHVTTTSGC